MSIRYIVVGLGNIGTRRRQVLGSHYVGGVDPLNREADWLAIDDVPPETYDAAVLSVPNQVKIDLLSRLLAMGKDVLVEKPLMFPDCDTASATRDLAHQTGTVWYTSYPHRFEPLIVRLKGLLAEGVIGPVYNARLVYGNGTVKNCIGTWRESGYGVLEDLGCHLIDLTEFLFNYTSCDYRAWEASCIESQVLDHCVYATADRKVVLECATTMWKNEFGIDIYGQMGSLHMQGLRKWGPTELIIRKRVFPSGVPVESREICDGFDQSWHADVEEFERRVASKVTSYESDLGISMSLHKLAHDVEHLP